MTMYGQMEVAYFQVTPLGIQRAQNPGTTKGLEQSDRSLLLEFAKRGTMEIDEIKFAGGFRSPNVANESLRHLVDLGYVQPVQFSSEGSDVQE